LGSFGSPVVHKLPIGGGWRGPGLGSVTVLTLFSGRHLMHVRRALALTVVVPLLLAGCSDDEPTPKMPDPPPSSSSTPSPSETETAEAESAEEFIRRWVEAGDEMQVTGETAEFRQLSRKCQACGQAADQVEAIYASGGSIDFDGTRVGLLKRVASNPPTFHLKSRDA